MLEQKNSLPGADLYFAIDNGEDFARAGERHANVRGAVVGTFVVVFVVRILGNETFEKFFQIASRRGRGILHDDQTAARVADEHRYSACRDFASSDDFLHFVSDFVRPLPFRSQSKIFAVNSHRDTLTAAPRAASFRFAQCDEDWIVCSAMEADLERVLFDEKTIHRRLDELAAQIANDYRDRELTVIAVLNGSVILMADLLRRLPMPLKLDCLSVASYHGGSKTTGELVFRQLWMPDIAGRHVLLLDDILDSGVTLATIREKIASIEPGPQSVSICVLLEKTKTRLRHVDADYVGFQIGDEFVVGYGLDYQQRFRNLPFIATLRSEALREPGAIQPADRVR